MGWFKRLCLFVFGLAGILALVALSLPWVGPYTDEAESLLYVPEYFYVLEALVVVTGVGCAICLLRSLFTPRNRKSIIIAREGGDQITVTRAAIASQAEHIVERDGTCVAGTVRVNARKHGNVKVYVRVTPRRSLDVVEKGEQLHAELDEGLAMIAADKIKSVNLEFTDPEEMDVDVARRTSADDGTPSYADTSSDDETGIRVSMSAFHRSDDDVRLEDDVEPDADEGLVATADDEPEPEITDEEPVTEDASAPEAALASDDAADTEDGEE